MNRRAWVMVSFACLCVVGLVAIQSLFGWGVWWIAAAGVLFGCAWAISFYEMPK